MLSSPENQNAKQVLSSLSAQEDGLSQKEVAIRIEKNGRNELAQKKSTSPIIKFLMQFNDPMIYILLAAAIVSILLKEVTDSVIILVVVLINGIVGYVQEAKAEKAIDALKKMSTPRAVVRRGGNVEEIDAAQLVVGDIVLLEAGRVVPADLRLIESSNLKIEESALTGESVPSEKNSTFVAEGDTALGDRINMAYMTTSVTYGRSVGVVTAIGMDTEIGKIAKILEESRDEMTPLQKRMADLGKVLGILTVGLCVALFLVALLQNRNVFEMLLTAISLAVAAIPEGLPAVVTIVLALGVQRMVKSNTIVRRLPAVETLGAVNVVCSDKTGTLTQNRMTTVKCYFDGKSVKPRELDPNTAAMYLEGFTLCNDASIEGGKNIGDPTETALLDMSALFSLSRPGLEQKYPRINELPFDSDRKMMTTVHNYTDRKISYTKGAIDVILKYTKSIWDGGKMRPMTREDMQMVNAAASEMAQGALRVLALSFRECEGEAVEEDLCFLGLVGMIDPPRPEAKQAVESCRNAGVKTVMITGDHKDTALAVAREIGIADDVSQCISGEELSRMTQEELDKKVSGLRVFARVSPEHKVMIVRALRENGNIVSMTGDGVNDAPSLRAADIGIAMGITGTDVAKGAADMILTDDNFATIRKAIEEGRNIYNNIKKSTLYLLSSNIGEVVTMFIGVLLGWPSPLSAVNILWVNLVTDSLPALALGADPGTPDVMKEKPRAASESLFAHGGVALLIIYGILIGMTTLFGVLLGWPSPLSAVNILWVNLVTDSLPALALGADPGTPDVMKEKPRAASESLFAHGGVALLIIYGMLIGVTTLFGFLLGCHEATFGSRTFALSALAHIDFTAKNVIIEGRTFAVTVLAVSELFHAIGMRDTKKSIFHMNHLNNKMMWISVGLGLVLQFLIVQTPLSRVFDTTPLSLVQWATVLLLAALPLVMHEIIVLVHACCGHDTARQ